MISIKAFSSRLFPLFKGRPNSECVQLQSINNFSSKARVRRDKHRRFQARDYEIERFALKTIARDQRRDAQLRLKAQMQLHSLPANSRPISVHDRCVVSGRGRGMVNEFRISRIVMRDWAHRGLLPGVTKSSWWRINLDIKSYHRIRTLSQQQIINDTRKWHR